MLKNNMTEVDIPTCGLDYCNEKVKWNIRTNIFDSGCCMNHNKRLTSIKNFGTEHPNQNKNQIDKVKKSVQDKYGVDSIAQLDSTKQKIKETTKVRYNVDSIAQLDSTKKKIKDTMVARHGVEYAQQSETIRSRTKETNLLRFGVEEALSDPTIRAKGNETNLERYGSIFPMRNEELLKRRQDTIIEKYDAYSPIAIKIDENKNYHLNKSLEAENNNKTYYHFFDTELEHKTKQIEWIKTQCITQVINEINFQPISHEVRDKFISDQSLYPKDTHYRHNFGVYSNDVLVAIFSGYEKQTYYEITRFVIKIGISFSINILRSFMDYIAKDKPVIISFDRRFTPFNQPLLLEAGFEFVGGTEPKKINDDIWDCGKLVYKFY